MTDRTLRLTDLDDLDMGPAGLVPVVAQDHRSGEVLMLAWANRDALALSLETGSLHFWSRSRGELWRKGESSGNTLSVVSLHTPPARQQAPMQSVVAQSVPAPWKVPPWAEQSAWSRSEQVPSPKQHAPGCGQGLGVQVVASPW